MWAFFISNFSSPIVASPHPLNFIYWSGVLKFSYSQRFESYHRAAVGLEEGASEVGRIQMRRTGIDPILPVGKEVVDGRNSGPKQTHEFEAQRWLVS
jgi:hypothetical protein